MRSLSSLRTSAPAELNLTIRRPRGSRAAAATKAIYRLSRRRYRLASASLREHLSLPYIWLQIRASDTTVNLRPVPYAKVGIRNAAASLTLLELPKVLGVVIIPSRSVVLRIVTNRRRVALRERGFTLLELLITIAIAAIVLALAAPSFSAMLMNNKLTAQSGGLNAALNYARNTALSQNINVQICPVGALNSTTCGTNWASGWMVVRDPTGTPTLLQSRQTPAGNPVLSSTAASVTFDPRGLSTTQSSFKFCDRRGAASARSVQVFATGFVQAGTTPGQVAYGTAALVCP